MILGIFLCIVSIYNRNGFIWEVWTQGTPPHGR